MAQTRSAAAILSDRKLLNDALRKSMPFIWNKIQRQNSRQTAQENFDFVSFLLSDKFDPDKHIKDDYKIMMEIAHKFGTDKLEEYGFSPDMFKKKNIVPESIRLAVMIWAATSISMPPVKYSSEDFVPLLNAARKVLTQLNTSDEREADQLLLPIANDIEKPNDTSDLHVLHQQVSDLEALFGDSEAIPAASIEIGYEIIRACSPDNMNVNTKSDASTIRVTSQSVLVVTQAARQPNSNNVNQLNTQSIHLSETHPNNSFLQKIAELLKRFANSISNGLGKLKRKHKTNEAGKSIFKHIKSADKLDFKAPKGMTKKYK